MRRRKSIRLRHYDYSWAGAYFVTICTKGRVQLFGHMRGEGLVLNEIGLIAEACWHEIPSHFANVQIDEFVVMPDHVHGIVVIVDQVKSEREPGWDSGSSGGVQLNAPTEGGFSGSARAKFSILSPHRGTLGVIIRTYKAAVTTNCRRKGHSGFGWQRGYYDHIVRDERSLARIREYIAANPQQWSLEKEKEIRSFFQSPTFKSRY